VSSSTWFYVIGAAASGSVGVPLENQPGSITDETATANAGSGSAHNNLQPYLAVNHIVKVL
jgi:microcystin-dependent protein